MGKTEQCAKRETVSVLMCIFFAVLGSLYSVVGTICYMLLYFVAHIVEKQRQARRCQQNVVVGASSCLLKFRQLVPGAYTSFVKSGVGAGYPHVQIF